MSQRNSNSAKLQNHHKGCLTPLFKKLSNSLKNITKFEAQKTTASVFDCLPQILSLHQWKKNSPFRELG
jgi:hypothetical protein